MGRLEAEADGVEYYYDPNRGARGFRGTYVYKVPCSVCGRKTESLSYSRNKIYICNRCKVKKATHKKEIEKAWFEVIEEKGEHRFNQALDAIEAQVPDMRKYAKAIKVARLAQDKYGSIPEAMVAIELIRLGYMIIPQQRVGRYRVDFYIPDDKMVVEVDGQLYHRDKYKGNREADIQLALGLDVCIVHVSAEKIAKDIRKLSKVIAIQTKNRIHGT